MSDSVTCPHCQRVDHQVKAGMNGGNQRYKCGFCRRRYTPTPHSRGYSDEIHREALHLRAQGLTVREVGERLGVSARSVADWVKRSEDERPPPPSEAATPPGAAPVAEQPGRRRPTIHDVADQAGVSISTVSNFLNQRGRMSGETGTRVEAAIQALHYTPSFFVRAIRQRRTHILGVLTFGLSDLDTDASVTAPLLQGVNDAADAADHEVLLYTGWPHRSGRYSGLNFLNGHVDGLLWVAPGISEPILDRLAAAGLPVMSLLSRHVPPGVGYVNADNIGAMHRIVTHLVALGHRRIAYLGPIISPNSNYADRRDGYRQAMADAGLLGEALETVPTADHWDPPICEVTMNRWLALPQPPTAIIACDDGIANLVLPMLHRPGLRVPEDVAVVGFNDARIAQTLAGGLTTIHQPFRQIARLGVERLIALVEGARVADSRLTLPAELIVRHSTAGATVAGR